MENIESNDEILPIAELLLKFEGVSILSSDSDDDKNMQLRMKELSHKRQVFQRKQHYIMESGTAKDDVRDWIEKEQQKLVHEELDINIPQRDNFNGSTFENNLSSDLEIEIIPDKKVSTSKDIKRLMREHKKRVQQNTSQDWKPKIEEKIVKERKPIETLEDLEERDWEAEEQAGLDLMKQLLRENQEDQDKKMDWNYEEKEEVVSSGDEDEDILEESSQSELDVALKISKNVIGSDEESKEEILTNIAPTLALSNFEQSQSATQQFFESTLRLVDEHNNPIDGALHQKETLNEELDREQEKEIIRNAIERANKPKETLSEWAGMPEPVNKIDDSEVKKYLENEAQISEDELGFGEGDDELNTDDELDEFHDDLKLDLQNGENAKKGEGRVKRLHRKQEVATDKQQTVDLLKDLTAGTLGMTREQRLALKEKGFAMDGEEVDLELLELERSTKTRKRKKKDSSWSGPAALGHFGTIY
eukprot:NODE_477_length_6979_cov_0.820058.p2 type:complete len:477 gc:universal NODE_477_length_6979_cov_0.820058:4399-5829(+)